MKSGQLALRLDDSARNLSCLEEIVEPPGSWDRDTGSQAEGLGILDCLKRLIFLNQCQRDCFYSSSQEL